MTTATTNARPRFKTATPQFSVPDVVATASYYKGTLGFEVLGFFGDPPVFATVGRDDVEIFFNQLPPGHPTARVRAPVAYDAYLHVTGVDALAVELRARGAVIREGPTDRSYHMREVIVSDLNGLVLAFGEDMVGRAT
jgi:catechol 2,3-dioxygenase-like lactoylglutathione lyase family enzyme